MKKFITLIFSAVIFSIHAQNVDEKDSIVLAQAPVVADSLILKDTVKMELVNFPSDLDFIPADETPELIADRLNCLQRTIELSYNSKVHAFVDYFTVRDRDYTKMILRRRDLYFPLFEKKLKQYNLPDELKYLSIIESGLNPRAMSAARAVGLWQFMSGTGKYFGLHSDWFSDDRMDPEKATDAACRYLSQLNSIFHNWHLALAAYNSGPGTVRWAIRRSGYKKTFWEIYPYLPRETRSYVPQFIAIIYAVNYAAEHNINEEKREELIPHDTVALNHFIQLEIFAKLTGTCVEDLQMLNPHFKRNAVPEDGKPKLIKVPRAAKENLARNRKTILDSASSGKKTWEALVKASGDYTFGREQNVYRVRSGDVLGTIAQRFGVSVRDLREWNNLRSNMIRVGQRLVIWVAPSPKVAVSHPTSPASDARVSAAQPGDHQETSSSDH